jgi:hypothetical protein
MFMFTMYLSANAMAPASKCDYFDAAKLSKYQILCLPFDEFKIMYIFHLHQKRELAY